MTDNKQKNDGNRVQMLPKETERSSESLRSEGASEGDFRRDIAGSTPTNVEEPLSLTPAEWRILGAIAISCGKPITKSAIAGTVRCAIRTVDRAVSHFTRIGLIKTTYVYSEGGAQIGNSYHIQETFQNALQGARQMDEREGLEPSTRSK